MRISDWSSDVCSSDLLVLPCAVFVDVEQFGDHRASRRRTARQFVVIVRPFADARQADATAQQEVDHAWRFAQVGAPPRRCRAWRVDGIAEHRVEIGRSRSEEHTSELQSLMRISYAVFCLKQKTSKRSRLQTTP